MGLDRPLALLALLAVAAVFLVSRRRNRGGAVPVALSAWGGPRCRRRVFRFAPRAV